MLNPKELDTVLLALRMLQRQAHDAYVPMTSAEFDSLCERLNCGDGCVQGMLDLSTMHWPDSEAFARLEALGDAGPRCADHEHGGIVFVGGVPSLELLRSLPDWLVPIYIFAVQQGVVLINFDRDADEDSRFEIWNW